LSTESFLSRAGQWFLRSGIQEESGGVARYYLADIQRNKPVSTEITGYAASTFVYLHSLTGEKVYLERAVRAARFLTRTAWRADVSAMLFETEPTAEGLLSYFFDGGIIVRGLLSAWRATGEDEFLQGAVAAGQSMMRDFAAGGGEYHPILRLPEKEPLPRDSRWSRSTGCYQLKSAMAWHDLAEATGDDAWRRPYEDVLGFSLRTYGSFLPGHSERNKVMDRLHAYAYFLEGLLPRAHDPLCAAALCDGIRRVAVYLREIAPEFERSDVYAQLLRVRLYADWAGVAALDRAAAEFEAERLRGFQHAGGGPSGYQAQPGDPRIEGGFAFGRKDGHCLPFVNPVSTAFALQALALWEGARAGAGQAHRHLLI
jgi:hypothetical protein